jgi:hypothetical protein
MKIPLWSGICRVISLESWSVFLESSPLQVGLRFVREKQFLNAKIAVIRRQWMSSLDYQEFLLPPFVTTRHNQHQLKRPTVQWTHIS